MTVNVYFKDRELGMKAYHGVTDVFTKNDMLSFVCNGWRVEIPRENVQLWEYEVGEHTPESTGPVVETS